MKRGIKVLFGQRKEWVGNIPPSPGLKTNVGVIVDVSTFGVVTAGGRRYVLDEYGLLSVTHSEAIRRGYPEAEGCERFEPRTIKRSGQYITA